MLDGAIETAGEARAWLRVVVPLLCDSTSPVVTAGAIGGSGSSKGVEGCACITAEVGWLGWVPLWEPGGSSILWDEAQGVWVFFWRLGML